MKNIIPFFVFCIYLSSCTTDPNKKTVVDSKTVLPFSLSQNQKDLVVSNNAFGFDIFKSIVAAEKNKNVFISPFSISLALAMIYNGANGDTKTEMQNGLRFPDFTSDEFNAYFLKQSNSFTAGDPSFNLLLANSIWYRNGFSILPSFIKTNHDYYNAEVNSLDFNNSSAVNTINSWVANKTNNLIQQAVNQIDPAENMLLVNAIYFKGVWEMNFFPEETKEMNFYLFDSTVVKAPFMSIFYKYPTFSSDSMLVFEMYYKKGNFAMDIILPNKGYSTTDIISNLTSAKWNLWMKNLSLQQMYLTMPKFKFSYERKLNNDLKSLGMSRAFSSEADFTNISSGDGFNLGTVNHQSCIEVNEYGTIAAAITVVQGSGASYNPDPLHIDVNRPFIFVIREFSNNTILFIGKVSNPVEISEK